MLTHFLTTGGTGPLPVHLTDTNVFRKEGLCGFVAF